MNYEFIQKIVEELEKSKKIDFKDSNKDLFFILKSGIDDIANSLYNWARDRGHIDSKIETFSYFSFNEEVQNQIFFGYPEEIIYKACLKLEQEGRAKIFDLSGTGNVNQMAVKFL